MNRKKATYRGQKANKGLITIQPIYPDEGYAVIQCGKTKVKIGYTLLHNLQFSARKEDPYWSSTVDIINALDSIKCEAMLGNTGDC